MKVNKVEYYKDGSIRIIPKEGGCPRWPKEAEDKERRKIEEDNVKRACFKCTERKESTEYHVWAEVCKDALQGIKERTHITIIKGNERRHCDKCWEDTMKENRAEYRKDGSIRIIPKEGGCPRWPKEAENKRNKKIKVDDIERNN